MGGVGHDLSHIRPHGATVSNAALTSSGVTSFAERFSNSTREVAQDGRRGALMLSISSRHPDSEKFVDMKMEEGKITGANVSLKADDDFMKAAISGNHYWQKFPIDLNHGNLETFNIDNDVMREYHDDNGNKGFIRKSNAEKLFDKLVYNAWKSAEPGLLFWDRILYESPARGYGEEWKEKSTNPCGRDSYASVA